MVGIKKKKEPGQGKALLKRKIRSQKKINVKRSVCFLGRVWEGYNFNLCKPCLSSSIMIWKRQEIRHKRNALTQLNPEDCQKPGKEGMKSLKHG